MRLFSLQRRRRILSLKAPSGRDELHAGGVSCISIDGAHLLSGGGDGAMHLFDLEDDNGRPFLTLRGHGGFPISDALLISSAKGNPSPSPSPSPRQLHEDFALEPAETEVLKRIHHPNITELIDLVSTEQCVYLVMELVMGGHLQARLKTNGPYEEPRARGLLRQINEAVQHMHERNIIHRDIKPENILFSEHCGE